MIRTGPLFWVTGKGCVLLISAFLHSSSASVLATHGAASSSAASASASAAAATACAAELLHPGRPGRAHHELALLLVLGRAATRPPARVKNTGR